jgi:hypothetical protein
MCVETLMTLLSMVALKTENAASLLKIYQQNKSSSLNTTHTTTGIFNAAALSLGTSCIRQCI